MAIELKPKIIPWYTLILENMEGKVEFRTREDDDTEYMDIVASGRVKRGKSVRRSNSNDECIIILEYEEAKKLRDWLSLIILEK